MKLSIQKIQHARALDCVSGLLSADEVKNGLMLSFANPTSNNIYCSICGSLEVTLK